MNEISQSARTTPPFAACENMVPDAEIVPRQKTRLEQDQELMERCVQGDLEAWDKIYLQCQPALLLSIKTMLIGKVADPNLAEEISARVWYAMIKEDGKLLARYDSKKGARLITFLRVVAKSEIAQHFRSEARRHRRELIAAGNKDVIRASNNEQAVAQLWDFEPTLTAAEKEFYEEYLIENSENGTGDLPLSAGNRKLRSRIKNKLIRFLDDSND